MQINFAVLIDDGKCYARNNPGIAIVDYADIINWKEERDENFWNNIEFHYQNKSKFSFSQTVTSNTIIEDIEKEIVNIIGFNWEKYKQSHIKTYILIDNEFVYIENSLIKIDKIWEYYGLKKELQIFFVFSNQAGNVWVEDGLRYYIQSKEQGCHNEPHVHVDYKHEYSASVCLHNGEILAGKLPNKVYKKVKERVLSNREFLLKCWNKRTDGMNVDINHFVGNKPIVTM